MEQGGRGERVVVYRLEEGERVRVGEPAGSGTTSRVSLSSGRGREGRRRESAAPQEEEEEDELRDEGDDEPLRAAARVGCERVPDGLRNLRTW